MKINLEEVLNGAFTSIKGTGIQTRIMGAAEILPTGALFRGVMNEEEPFIIMLVADDKEQRYTLGMDKEYNEKLYNHFKKSFVNAGLTELTEEEISRRLENNEVR